MSAFLKLRYCCYYLQTFLILYILGAFAKLLKTTISFNMSVYPPVRMEQLRSQWTDFHGILFLGIIRKICWENSIFIKIWQE